ncbi:hypothetical protein LPJ64_005149 [Coemansia asiatica]|uniref:Transmembrane protein n=1 Tax=Coemansia asiatica TaxID=1052880 RepID=A0A9W8CIB8_9FUNG|nr:hypothetical protein LPJ64_005149 [Coemansia asiatica]KAJ2853821.1 hypothetical protein FB639_006481 [Coemansia asiatica]
MSYVDYIKRGFELVVMLAASVHQKAYPLSSAAVLQLGKTWPPFETLSNLLGPLILTYTVEVIGLYLAFIVFSYIIRMLSNTLYRLISMVLTITVVALGVCLGLYFYFTHVSSGKQQAKAMGDNFWLTQVVGFVGQLAPLWDTQQNSQSNWQAKVKFQQHQGRGF